MIVTSFMFQRGLKGNYMWAFSSSATPRSTCRFIKDSLDSSIFLLEHIKRKG